MSLHVNGDDFMMAIHVVRIVGTVISAVMLALLIAWAVRPSRRRQRRDRYEDEPRDEARLDGTDLDDMWRILDRMDARLEVLERAMVEQTERPRALGDNERDLAPASDGRDSGRTQ